MEILYLLESIRNPVLDALMSFITLFGGEIMFMVAGMIMFWCVDKYEGYYVLTVGFFGTVINQFLKIVYRIPRPWVKDPSFTIVESARADATGYSFPSGHTQSSVGTFGAIALGVKKTRVKILSLALVLLVPFSRMYLGVHTPLDVGVSFLVALVLIFILRPLVKSSKEKPLFMWALIGALALLIVVFLSYLHFAPFPEEVLKDDNYAHALKNAYTMLGCLAGMALIFFLDRRFINFDTKAPLPVQIIKTVLGFIGLLAVKEGLKAPINALNINYYLGTALRYFLMVVFAGAVWPLSFKPLNEWSKKWQEKKIRS
jgi:undecaprenyl-diphosphatase